VAGIPFTGEPFFPSDLSVSLIDVLAVAIGVPLGAAVAARIALRRVQISPLGVSRRVTPKPPRARRLVLLVLGIAELAYFVGRRPETTSGQIAAYLSGIFAVMIGLVLAGPWLTMIGSRVLARRASGPSALIAGRRLADNPHAGFRAVSGLMLALFVTALATGIITSIVADGGDPRTDSPASHALSQFFWPDERPDGAPPVGPAAIPAGLGSIPGVRSVLTTRVNPAFQPAVNNDERPGLIACDALAAETQFGRCPAGARVVTVSPDLLGDRFGGAVEQASVWHPVAVGPDELARLPLLSIVVSTDGRAATIERARTLLENAFPGDDLPATEAEFRAEMARDLIQWQQLANVVILTSLPIAGCSLAVSVAGGLSERRRPFSLLRLTGVRIGVLRRVVALESAVPLLAVAVLATGMGFLTAYLFLKAQLNYSLHPPGVGYFAIVLAGLAASLGIIASTMPLLRRITGPETARNE
jgi:hypothetical protein